MISQLRKIQGINIPNLPFQLERVGDLLFFDWPLITIYISTDNFIYIKSILEEGDDVIRCAIFKTDKHLIKSYIDGEVPYVEVLTNPQDGLYFIEDVYSDGTTLITIIAGYALDKEYIPQIQSFVDKDDSRDFPTIISTLHLDQIDTSEAFNILEEAQRAKSDLINLHFSSANNVVGYGKMQSQVFGEALISYHKLSEVTAVSIYNKPKIDIDEEKLTIKEIKRLAVSEYSYSKAASFSVFLKPIKVVIDNDGESSTEKIQSSIFSLFEIGDDFNELKKHPEFSVDVLGAYSSFLKVVSDNDIKVDVRYANVVERRSYFNSFNKSKSEKIIKVLAETKFTDAVLKTYEGAFAGTSSRKKIFEFVTTNGEVFEGKFAASLTDQIYKYPLNHPYRVDISTRQEESTGKKSIKQHIVISVKDIEN